MTGDAEREGRGDGAPGDVPPRDVDAERPEAADAPRPQGPADWAGLDVDAEFAAIVAQFGRPGPAVGPWPVNEDLDTGRPGTPGGTPSGRDGRRRRRGDVQPGDTQDDDAQDGDTQPGDTQPGDTQPGDTQPGDTRPGDTRPGDARPGDEDDADPFVPPIPPPLPRGDLISRLAWTCVIGGPLFLVLAAMLWRDLPGTLLLTALAAFVGGFVTLVARMPGERPDDPDDGAVV